MVDYYIIIMKKTYKGTDKKIIIQDITRAFNYLISGAGLLYHITITDIPTKSPQHLKHTIKNGLLKKIWRAYKDIIPIPLNYLFVVEYGGIISYQLDYEKINNLGLHVHLVLQTNLNKKYLDYYINKLLKNSNYLIDRIDNNSHKKDLIGYITKQRELFTSDNYDYKIN
jgi:hypothetical protein